MLYLFLFLLYATIPPVTLYSCLRLIYQKNNKYAWHLHYFAKYAISLSFLPLLYLPKVELALAPKSPLSLLFLAITFSLAILGIKPAIKNKVLYFYFGGVYAAFMEEILFRGILLGIAQAAWGNTILSVVTTSIAFGFWHLKNYAWHSDKQWVITSFLMTSLIYGPLFCSLRLLTGDIYLASLWHFITDAYVALAPKSMRWTIIGDRNKGVGYQDNYLNPIKS